MEPHMLENYFHSCLFAGAYENASLKLCFLKHVSFI